MVVVLLRLWRSYSTYKQRCNCRRCRRRESLQKLSVFFHKLRFMEVVEVMEVVLWRLWRSWRSYSTYKQRLKPLAFIIRLGSSVSSTLASQLGGPRGPWIKSRRRCNCRHCRRWESILKLGGFFYKLRTMNTSKSRTKIGVSKDTIRRGPDNDCPVLFDL